MTAPTALNLAAPDRQLANAIRKAAQGEAVQDTDTGCAFYTAANIGSDEIAPNLYD